ncbi:hypothetical protein LSTR_LSTR008104 [Laodelphax striatellus]|uniref:rRNA biogenesis protein RRP36 n=1 Tax=Laodelphax striatellus TaxID=195883 RepID=A0A482XE47_LAOST|nr:hypothetical protein LSTR_LSTR008104 [Laodelphax striatellus]
MLQKELMDTTDAERKRQIKFLFKGWIKRERRKRKQLKELKDKEEKKMRKQAVKDGKKPFYCKKSEKRLLELLVDNYEQLRKSGKLNKHLKKEYGRKIIIKKKKKERRRERFVVSKY